MANWAGEVSALYKQYVHSKGSFFSFCADELLETVDVPAGGRVLDLAGGAGITAAKILQKWPTADITILDASADQLDHARHVFGDKVQYVLGKAETYFPDEHYDLVVCANAFWYLQPSVIGRIASWLTTDGTFAFNLHENNTQFRDQSFFSHVYAEIDRLSREQHRRPCQFMTRTVSVEQLTQQLHAAGFTVTIRPERYDEPRENWRTLCELEARRTAPFMALAIDGEAKLALYRAAFKTVSKQLGEITRETLIITADK